MKISITGSLGNVSRPLACRLVQQGHAVTVVSSKSERRKEIEAIGATAAIGTMEDADFLAKTFKGADAVYVMEAFETERYLDKQLNIIEAISKVVNNYKQAIQQAGVKRIVHLSSMGAHTDVGTGLLAVHYHAETILRQLPDDVSITHIRPAGFYNNLFQNIPLIKGRGFLAHLLAFRYYGLLPLLRGQTGILMANYGGADKTVWVSPLDIADVVAEELIKPFRGRNVRYVASDEMTCDQVATIIGEAIGKPYLKWVTISDKQMQTGAERFGMPKQIAKALVEMNAGIHSGLVHKDYFLNRPEKLGTVKMVDFAREFAAVYADHN
ncbi:NAD-dependent epimerase/dehydratase family protein [Spirosoma sp. KCTC 42546]|uniref:NAD(P)H-binding protein n=1 Tax=Spirosoma sp. KCTC 42546 TaxID=2520506 RepID=UPI001156D4A3|nr:NAD(P)H-binding protein [Spirosoma sp. KCTC 42546]QDK82357.1 NAD-dependent epimerase/dehydratase family protein [Spirosoma sp. KCTC 42546]